MANHVQIAKDVLAASVSLRFYYEISFAIDYFTFEI